MTKLMSITICTYNGQAYLSEVIESILAQECFDEIIDKLIIVDNASTDNTKNIILHYQSLEPLIEYIYESTPGLSHARKHGALVNSDWVAYLDDDNLVMPGWIKEAKKYIEENPNIGVFNGVSIPMIRHNATEEEITMLKAIYPSLACTHYNIEQYKANVKSELKGPFGAGMILRTKQLKEFLDAGWTHNEGRKGEKLGSGEDGEIASSVIEKGFSYGFNKKMALWHIIPAKRLEKNYVKRLLIGLDIGYYNYISNKNNYIYYRMRTFLKSLFIIVVFPLQIILSQNPVKKIKLRNSVAARIRLTGFILRDIFIFRR